MQYFSCQNLHRVVKICKLYCLKIAAYFCLMLNSVKSSPKWSSNSFLLIKLHLKIVIFKKNHYWVIENDRITQNNLFLRKVEISCAQATELKEKKNHKLRSSIGANYLTDLKTTNQIPEITSRPTRIPIQLKPFRVSRENLSDLINLLKRPLPT